MPVADPTAGIHDAPVSIFLSVLEPRLARKRVEPGRISTVGIPESLSADEARQLAAGLCNAADELDKLNASALPHLQRFAAVVDDFFGEETI